MLVTDWNPLTVWIYTECYIRFAMMDYDPKNKIRFAHLTNNCLVKKFQKLDSISPLKNGGKMNNDSSASTSKKTNHTTGEYDE